MGAVGTPIETDDMLPAPAQGAIGVEARSDDDRVRALLAVVDDAHTHVCVAAERRLLEALGGDCRSPVAALAVREGDAIRLRAELLTGDGTEVESAEASFDRDDDDAPAELAAALLDRASPALRALFGR
jgi:hydroxymethylbilane synthase